MMSEYEMLQMRGVSLLLYGAFFVGLYLARKKIYSNNPDQNSLTERKLLKRFSALGLIFYIASVLIFIAINTLTFSSLNTAFELFWLFLYKAIGVPLSVSLIYSCAKLSSADRVKIASIGISGAFLIQASFSLITAFLAVSPKIVVIIGSAFTIVSFFCARVLIKRQHTESECQTAQNASQAHSSKKDAETTSRYYVVSIFIASFMLGFLRYTAQDEYFLVEPVIALGFLLLIIGVVLSKKKIDSNVLIIAAILCGSASILLQPLFGGTTPYVIQGLEGVGLILFETSAWIFAVQFTQSQPRPLVAASLSRAACVAGHFLGTAGSIGATALRGNTAEAQNLIALVIVLVYLFFLAIVFEKTRIFSQKHLNKSEDDPDLFWKIPSEYLAEKHQLTVRETQVLEQLARGNTIGSMEDTFFLSRNTLKMHIRHVYLKLDIHSKQEAIDLVNKTRVDISEH